MERYQVVGTRRSDGENEIVYEGPDHPLCDQRYSENKNAEYSALQVLEDGDLIDLSFKKKPFWSRR